MDDHVGHVQGEHAVLLLGGGEPFRRQPALGHIPPSQAERVVLPHRPDVETGSAAVLPGGKGKVVDDERAVGGDPRTADFEQAVPLARREEFQQMTPHDPGPARAEETAGRLVGIGDEEIRHLLLVVAHRLEDRVGIEEGVERGAQPRTFRVERLPRLRLRLDVAPAADVVDDLAAVIQRRAEVDGEPPPSVALDVDADLDREADALRELREGGVEPAPVVGVDHVAERATDQLGRGPVGHGQHGRGDPFDDAGGTAAHDDIGCVLRQQAVFLLTMDQLFPRLDGLADVAEGDTEGGRGVLRAGDGHLQAGPERGTVRLDQPQAADLKLLLGQHGFLRQIENILIAVIDPPGEGRIDQGVPGHPELLGRREVRFEDDPAFGQHEVADGGEIEEVEIPRAGGFEGFLQAQQFLVLQLQLDLVHEEFVQRLVLVPGGRGRLSPLRNNGLGLATQGAVPPAHAPPSPGLSVMATA